MNTIRKWIRNTFGFSGREINGFIVLLPLMIILIATQPLYHAWVANRTDDFSKEQSKLDSLALFFDEESVEKNSSQKQASLFLFNPNKASVSELTTLGFPENLSSRIASYRQKGGQFRIKSDLLKIYGIDSTLYHKLYPFIQLPERAEKKDFYVTPLPDQQKKILISKSFDLNFADTAQLISVYGIGPALATRIIKFRNGLGGFISEAQLKEVYGLDSIAVQQLLKVSFIAENFEPKKINMNQANEIELSAHPYIRKSIAKAIIAYRFQHGGFNRVEDLAKLNHLKPEEVERIIPYLKIEN